MALVETYISLIKPAKYERVKHGSWPYFAVMVRITTIVDSVWFGTCMRSFRDLGGATVILTVPMKTPSRRFWAVMGSTIKLKDFLCVETFTRLLQDLHSATVIKSLWKKILENWNYLCPRINLFFSHMDFFYNSHHLEPAMVLALRGVDIFSRLRPIIEQQQQQQQQEKNLKKSGKSSGSSQVG